LEVFKIHSRSKIEAALEDRNDEVVEDDYMDIDRYMKYVAEIKLCRAEKVVREKLVLFL
jgi:phage terminase small subunit